MKIEDVIRGTPYAGYLYSYPHKTAYRPLAAPVPLDRVWSAEAKSALFLYLHVPFCEMRCGFCNLFTSANPKDDLASAYLTQLEHQARATRDALGAGAKFARLAIGGGTPTHLPARDLERLFAIAEKIFGIDCRTVPASVETSPETADRERLGVLSSRGVERISIGVQSFLESECHAVARPQKTDRVHGALDAIRSEKFRTLNIDLIYGIPEQTENTFQYSLDAALEYRPEEIYLYPLYVRPLTGLFRMKKSWDDHRLELYRFGRDYLFARGYRQVSMRMFERSERAVSNGPVYCCQTDGMIGLGPGARSYTRALHYSSEYAVTARPVKELIASWNERTPAELAGADYGIALDVEDQKRRFIILSLLASGLELEAYRKNFDAYALEDFQELCTLVQHGLAKRSGSKIELTEEGIERADAIGPYLHSARVRGLMKEYELR